MFQRAGCRWFRKAREKVSESAWRGKFLPSMIPNGWSGFNLYFCQRSVLRAGTALLEPSSISKYFTTSILIGAPHPKSENRRNRDAGYSSPVVYTFCTVK